MNPGKKHLLVGLEDEPYPHGPTGESCRLKVADWRALATALKSQLDLEVVEISELRGRKPEILEGFSRSDTVLDRETFPTSAEHLCVNSLPSYWPQVVKSGVAAIPVIEGEPKHFPLFVRGEQGTFAGGGRVGNYAELQKQRSTGRRLVVRPYVKIRPAGTRPAVTLELRVHVVCGKAAAVEYLFPKWADQKPTDAELATGHAWTRGEAKNAVASAERVAREMACRWLVVDFAGIAAGMRLVELNPGWCAGIAHAEAARCVHIAILRWAFDVDAGRSLMPAPTAAVPYNGESYL